MPLPMPCSICVLLLLLLLLLAAARAGTEELREAGRQLRLALIGCFVLCAA